VSLEKAKKNGAKIISINPLPEAGLMRFKQAQDFTNPVGFVRQMAGSGTPLTDIYLPVRINGDVAVLKGLAKALLEIDDAEQGAALNELTDGSVHLPICSFGKCTKIRMASDVATSSAI
jgi:hypothetical protein